MTDIYKLGLDFDTTSAKTGAADLEKLDAAGKKLGPTIDKVGKGAEKLNASLKKNSPTVSKLEQDFQKMERQLSRFGVTIGLSIAAAVAAIVLFTKSIISADAALDDMSEMTGSSVESLSALRNVAYVSGQSFDSIRMAMGKLSQTLSIVDDESKAAAVALHDLGLSVDEIKRMNPDEQMLTIAKALDKFADSGSKSAIIQALYKRGAQELLPFLKDLAREGQLVATVTQQQAKDAEDLEKAYRRIMLGIREFLAGGVREIAPLFVVMGNAMRPTIDAADDMEDSFNPLTETFRALAILGANVTFVIKQMAIEAGGLAARLAAFARGDFASPFSIRDEMIRDAEKARKDLDALEKRLLNAGRNKFAIEGSSTFVGPIFQRPELNFDANAGKQTDAEKALEKILEKTNVGLTAELNKQIALIHEWVAADDKRTLQGVEAVNLLLEAYDRESGAFDEREKKRKEKEDAEKQELANAREREEFNREVDDAQQQAIDARLKQLEELDKEAKKNKKTIDDFNRTYKEQIDQIHQEGKAYSQTTLEREMAIAARKLESDYTEAQIGLNEDELATLKKIYELRKRQLADAIGGKVAAETLADRTKKETDAATKIFDNFVENVQRTLGDQLYQVMQGNFDNIGQAFLQMLQKMLADALAANLMQAIFDGKGAANMLGGLLSLFSPASSSASQLAAGVIPMARGGVVNSPTPFMFANGGAMNYGLMGEAGPEAIMPLKRDSTGRLGVMGGGKTIQVTYAPVYNIDSSTDRSQILTIVDRSVQRSNAELVEQLQRTGAI